MLEMLLVTLTLLFQLGTREYVVVETPIFRAIYSEAFQQPLELTYRSTNRPVNWHNQDGLSLRTVPLIRTSDANDYDDVIWVPGFLAPVTRFADTEENLIQTFTYLNVMAIHPGLYTEAWHDLELAEEAWDDSEPLYVTITLDFAVGSELTPSDMRIAGGIHKHIIFERTGKMRCWYFPNTDPVYKRTEDDTFIYSPYEESSCNHLPIITGVGTVRLPYDPRSPKS